MSNVGEGFELLDSLGINREVQQLFSEVLREDESGRLTADYRDENGRTVDSEILTVSNHKLSSGGILSFSPAPPENVRLLFIADAVMHLISMVHCKRGRMDFAYAAFMAIGARMDKEMVVSTLANYSKRIKIHTVFGHSLIGRIRDCKVQYWVKELDCKFGVKNGIVKVTFKGRDYMMGIAKFSLRNHLRQVGVRQTVSTCKSFNKNIDNFNLFNYF
ncbi:MAG: hypothetical protein WD398_11265 [Cyclobacteriaceae bacterium]